MKKIISLLLITIISLSLFGCRGKDQCLEARYTPLGTAEYPTQVSYPLEESFANYEEFSDAYSEWFDIEHEKNNIEIDDSDFREYVKNTLGVLAKDDGQNLVYSPANIYFALAMLAECTDSSTRNEILSVLGKDDISDLRQNANKLWQKLYADNGVYSSVLANSLWLRDGINYNQDTINILKDSYYASTASGNFSDKKYVQAIKEWINDNTKDLLNDSTKELKFNDATIAALVSTIYFKAKWDVKFNESLNETRDFNTSDGKVQTEFMNSSRSQSYYYGDGYSATSLGFEQDSRMYFILPDEQKSVYDIINSDAVLDIITGDADKYNYDGGVQTAYPIVNLTLPKFDVMSDTDLIECLETLGIKSAFDYTVSDFSPLTTDYPLFVSQAKHAARVKIDEEGCEAAAYTVIAKDAGAAPPKDEVDMVLDRPFIFAVSGKDGMPRFIGIVNQP